MPGITLKGIYGRQRAAFDNGLVNGEGLVRAVDGEVNLNYLLESWASKDLRLSFGGSFLSKFQDGNDITKDTLQLRLPKNVAAYQMRTEIAYKNLTFNGEFVHKINDRSGGLSDDVDHGQDGAEQAADQGPHRSFVGLVCVQLDASVYKQANGQAHLGGNAGVLECRVRLRLLGVGFRHRIG